MGLMGMDTNTRYKLMADATRRAVVSVLDPDGPPVSLANLARQVADHETEDVIDEAVESVESEPSRRVHLSLYHVHVPKLADAGIVSFDADRNTVTAGPHFDAVRSLVDGYREPAEAQ